MEKKGSGAFIKLEGGKNLVALPLGLIFSASLMWKFIFFFQGSEPGTEVHLADKQEGLIIYFGYFIYHLDLLQSIWIAEINISHKENINNYLKNLNIIILISVNLMFYS